MYFATVIDDTPNNRQIIHYWQGTENINDSAWIVPLLFILTAIQWFGVRGYGEVSPVQEQTIAENSRYQVEFTLAILKIIACIGFILLAIIIDCGGVPTDHRGYIGAEYWYDLSPNRLECSGAIIDLA